MSGYRHSLLLPEPYHIELLPDRAFPAPDREQRRGNPLASRASRCEKTTVDPGRSTVVLAHGMDRGRLAVGANIGSEDLRGDGARRLALDRKMAFHIVLWQRADKALRQGRILDLEEPPEILGRKALVGLRVHQIGRRNVEHDATLQGLRVVHHHELEHASAA